MERMAGRDLHRAKPGLWGALSRFDPRLVGTLQSGRRGRTRHERCRRPAPAAGAHANTGAHTDESAGYRADNVRLGPSTIYPVLQQVRAGQTLAITGKTPRADWWQVCCVTPSRPGWVSAPLVRAAGPLEKVRVIEPPALPPVPNERNVRPGVD